MSNPNLNEVDDFLFAGSGSGVPSFSFGGLKSPPGAKVEGILEKKELVQMRDIDDPNKLLWWDDAQTKPKMQMVLTLQTKLDNWAGTSADFTPPDGKEDDGLRRVFLSHRAKLALAKAVQESGDPTALLGSRISVQYVRDGEKTGRAKTAPREYEVTYASPADVDLGVKKSDPEPESTPAASGGTPDISSLSPDLQALVRQMAAGGGA
jgi:hypothetical protein